MDHIEHDNEPMEGPLKQLSRALGLIKRAEIQLDAARIMVIGAMDQVDAEIRDRELPFRDSLREIQEKLDGVLGQTSNHANLCSDTVVNQIEAIRTLEEHDRLT